MSGRAAVWLFAVLIALGAPATASAMVLTPVDDAPWGVQVAPGPGSSAWVLGRGLALEHADGTTSWVTPSDGWGAPSGWESRLAAGRDGSAWIDVDSAPQLERFTPDGAATTIDLPVNPLGPPSDDLDVATSGVAWATATVPLSPHSTRANTYVLRITPQGDVRMSPAVLTSTSAKRPTTIAAVSGDRAWLGVRCGRVEVRARAHDLALAPRRIACPKDNGRTPLALRSSPDGALWEVLSDGRVRRSHVGRTVTTGRLGTRLRRRVGLAFTGHGRTVHAWIRTPHRIVELSSRGHRTVHAPPIDPATGERLETRSLAADPTGGLWLITNDELGTLNRVDLGRCPVEHVVGLSITAAVEALRDAGCAAPVRRISTGQHGPWRIATQTVAAGAVLTSGSPVVLRAGRVPQRCLVDPRRATLLDGNGRWTLTSTFNRHTGYQSIRACNHATGRTWTVTDSWETDGEYRYTTTRPRGNWVLVEEHYASPISHEDDEDTTKLVLADLARHTRRTVASYGDDSWSDGEGGGGGGITGTVFREPTVGAHGDVAWLEPHAVKLLRADASHAATLSSDPSAAFAALTISGGRVRWTRDGVAASAKL